MFEKMVADAPTDALGEFIEVDSQSVRTGLWRGSPELHAVQLKASAFKGLGAPVELAGGSGSRQSHCREQNSSQFVRHLPRLRWQRRPLASQSDSEGGRGGATSMGCATT